ncbi:(E3-independent) E2 ubiquitin-conjugating enzyme UBE2O-like isoform X1 [Ornithodoros turicata]|uniref:(E3-independent) E2 ubiquitin-conjugating enzyme UBE2O-like isoform X1 n=1 Tax=Ornithodoros turicata TaxID=34597 RepID=UPI0031395ED6
MASNCKYFDEDSVYRINKKGRIEFGLVLENAEYVSSDEDDENSPSVPQWERMKRGHVRVAWHPKGREEVLSEKRVKLHDRSLMPGDIVRKVVKGKNTQLGYCRNTEVYATVQIFGTSSVIANVNSRDLQPLERFSPDVAVFLDSWVGMIENVKSELSIRFQDGSRCIIQEDDAYDLDDVLDRRCLSSEFKISGYYKGQKLFGPMQCFENAKWLHRTKETTALLSKPRKMVQVTVDEVKVLCLYVQGVCKAYQDNASAQNDSELIKYVIEGETLDRVKMLNIFERCALQIGDRNYYTIKDSDVIVTVDEWKRQCASKYIQHPQHSDCPTRGNRDSIGDVSLVASHGDAGEVVNHRNEISDSDYEDIEDCDNTSDSTSVTSGSLTSGLGLRRPALITKFVPLHLRRGRHGPSLATRLLKKRKLHRPRKRPVQEQVTVNPGDVVVVEALSTDTVVEVVWQDGTVEENIPSSELYPIHHLDGHEFFPGDFVVENQDNPPAHEYGVVKQVDHSGRTAVVTMFKTYLAGTDPHPEALGVKEVSVYDIKDHPDFKYRQASCIIRVANFEATQQRNAGVLKLGSAVSHEGYHSWSQVHGTLTTDKDSESSAGQVVELHTSGKVEVQWVNGKKSLCYPQELYRIGEYDSDDLWEDGDDDDDTSSDDSWETESEKSLVGEITSPDGSRPATKLDAEIAGNRTSRQSQKLPSRQLSDSGNKTPSGVTVAGSEETAENLCNRTQGQIELLRHNMARLEELFTQNPALQNCTVVRKLLELYKHCKMFDHLLGTAYFQERCLQSLVDRLRQRGRINSTQHVSDQVARLFSSNLDSASEENGAVTPEDNLQSVSDTSLVFSEEVAEEPLQQVHPQPRKPTSVSTRLEGATGMSNVCHQLYSILKTKLLKAHEDVQGRFGMSAAQLENAANEPTLELESVVKEEEEAQKGEEENASKSAECVQAENGKVEEFAEEGTKGQGVFSTLEAVPDCHKYKLSILQPHDPKAFFRMVKKEMNLLNTSLPEGINVKSFEDRMDLYSVLIKGPTKTPYEDGVFLFDIQFPAEYPKAPPLVHYVSYCSDRLNPNLYEGGKVCVSLLGTWGGKGTEVWSPKTSSLLQVLISIQGLILVSEPYFNEAGYEQQRGSQQGSENSRMYNEMVVLKLVQALGKMIQNPPEVFKSELEAHFGESAGRFMSRLEGWLEVSEAWHNENTVSLPDPDSLASFLAEGGWDHVTLPEFPLLPASRGFCLTLRKSLAAFKEILAAAGIMEQ